MEAQGDTKKGTRRNAEQQEKRQISAEINSYMEPGDAGQGRRGIRDEKMPGEGEFEVGG